MRLEGVIGNSPIDANTDYIEAGGVIIGVEQRSLDAATVKEVMDKLGVPEEDRDKYLEEMPAVRAGGTEHFLSLHVFGPDRSEYLRFDNIDGGKSPHYHYCTPHENFHTAEFYDVEANGNFIEWTFDRLQHRLEPMLRKAHADEVVDKIDWPAFDSALAKAREVVASI